MAFAFVCSLGFLWLGLHTPLRFNYRRKKRFIKRFEDRALELEHAILMRIDGTLSSFLLTRYASAVLIALPAWVLGAYSLASSSSGEATLGSFLFGMVFFLGFTGPGVFVSSRSYSAGFRHYRYAMLPEERFEELRKFLEVSPERVLLDDAERLTLDQRLTIIESLVDYAKTFKRQIWFKAFNHEINDISTS
jgi:ABC-type multidrug transport system fused ATPase/permease subunit